MTETATTRRKRNDTRRRVEMRLSASEYNQLAGAAAASGRSLAAQARQYVVRNLRHQRHRAAGED